jgi:hypothetical protein
VKRTLISDSFVRRLRVRTFGLALLLAVHAGSVAAWAADPLVGTWLLTRQELNGDEAKAAPLQLTVYQIRESLSFAFASLVKDAFVTNMGYRVLLDGTDADVKNANGDKVGTVKMTSPRPSQYAMQLSRPNQPSTTGTLTVSADAKTLTAETDTRQGERVIHLKQIYARQ